MYCPKNNEKIENWYYCCNCDYWKGTYCRYEEWNGENKSLHKELEGLND